MLWMRGHTKTEQTMALLLLIYFLWCSMAETTKKIKAPCATLCTVKAKLLVSFSVCRLRGL